MQLTLGDAQDSDIRPRSHDSDQLWCWKMAVMGFMLLMVITPAATTPAHANGKPLPLDDPITFVRCVTTDVQSSFGIPESTYAVKGVCGLFKEGNTGPGSNFGNEVHIRDYPWTAEGKYNSSTKATSEGLIIHDLETRSIPYFDSTMQCPQDPWLTALSQPCLDIRDRTARILNDNLRKVLATLWGLKINVPYSSLIKTEQRAKLDQQYQGWRAALPKSKLPGPLVQQTPSPPQPMNPQGKNMRIPDDMLVIIKPVVGDHVPQGRLIITATIGKEGAPDPNDVTEVELRFLDAPQGQRDSYPYLTMVSVGTAQLLQGYPVTEFVTGGAVGRWQVRARYGMRTPPGPWSPPVQFQMVKAQPTPPMVQQTPLPNASVMPPPAANPPTQIKKSPFMIRPRGVDAEAGAAKVESPGEKTK